MNGKAYAGCTVHKNWNFFFFLSTFSMFFHQKKKRDTSRRRKTRACPFSASIIIKNTFEKAKRRKRKKKEKKGNMTTSRTYVHTYVYLLYVHSVRTCKSQYIHKRHHICKALCPLPFAIFIIHDPACESLMPSHISQCLIGEDRGEGGEGDKVTRQKKKKISVTVTTKQNVWYMF